jgi:hypothetical protein
MVTDRPERITRGRNGSPAPGAATGEHQPVASFSMSETTCQSCGDRGVETVLVRRLYITPEAWDQPASVRVDDDEWWCFVCRTHYPHQELGDDGEPVEHELGWSTENPGA